MNSTLDVLRNLLENLADRAEIERYLERFNSVDPIRFAIVKIGGGVLSDNLDEVASALAYLHGLGLYPVVVHGAGPQLDRAVEEADLETKRVDGMRVTSPEILNIMLRVIDVENLKLVDALGERNAPARPITSGVFEASLLDGDRLGLVGKVDRVHLELISAAVRAGQIPVVACLGETTSGQILNINADVATSALALSIKPEKTVFLTPTGGLLDETGNVIPTVNLAEDYERLMREQWVTGGMALKLREIEQLLSDLPRTSSVSITKAEHLAGELITDKGGGTLVRQGETIDTHSDLTGLDNQLLYSLLQRSVGRTVMPSYLDDLDPQRIYITTDYSAVAIITEELGVPYLDKFAVTTEAQGFGPGASLWNRLTDDTPQLFWRSRTGNPLNVWYFARAEGSWRDGEWVVFWYGMETAEEIAACRNHATSLRATVGPDNPS